MYTEMNAKVGVLAAKMPEKENIPVPAERQPQAKRFKTKNFK